MLDKLSAQTNHFYCFCGEKRNKTTATAVTTVTTTVTAHISLMLFETFSCGRPQSAWEKSDGTLILPDSFFEFSRANNQSGLGECICNSRISVASSRRSVGGALRSVCVESRACL